MEISKIISILSFFAGLVFLTVDFVAALPLFLFFENLFYSAFFILLAIYSNNKISNLATIIISSFVIGRMSRSIIDFTGSLNLLAKEHIFAVILLASILILSIINLKR